MDLNSFRTYVLVPLISHDIPDKKLGVEGKIIIISANLGTGRSTVPQHSSVLNFCISFPNPIPTLFATISSASFSLHTNIMVSFPLRSCTPITEQLKTYLLNTQGNIIQTTWST